MRRFKYNPNLRFLIGLSSFLLASLLGSGLFAAANTQGGEDDGRSGRLFSSPASAQKIPELQNFQNGMEEPSSGLRLYDRMGADLPALPPEKPYKGKVDKAFGAFQRGLYITALTLATPRAKRGDAAAQTLIARLLANGLGVKRDLKNAAFWYGEAAKNGDPSAMFQYALLLMEGKYVKHDEKKAVALITKAAKAGQPLAQFNYGQILVAENPGNTGLRNALPWYEKSANNGIADAQYAAAQILLSKRISSSKTDEQKGLSLLKRAAHAGFEAAEIDLAIRLIKGSDGPADFKAGFRWMLHAARAGNVVAQNKTAHLYIDAIGTRPNPVEAAKWYILSRRAGLEDPRLNDFYLGISDKTQKTAIQAANKFRPVKSLPHAFW